MLSDSVVPHASVTFGTDDEFTVVASSELKADEPGAAPIELTDSDPPTLVASLETAATPFELRESEPAAISAASSLETTPVSFGVELLFFVHATAKSNSMDTIDNLIVFIPSD